MLSTPIMRNGRVLARVAAGVSLGLIAHVASAAPLTAGNLIASVNEFTGSSTAPTYVAEYTVAGTRVQTLANVPPPGGGAGPTTEQARDLVLGPGNVVAVYNGTFDPNLAQLDLTAVTWNQQTFPGWSTVNNISYGGLAKSGQYIYASDMVTFGVGDTPQGVVRFDTLGGPTVRFAETTEPIDIYVSPDNVLYTLGGGGVQKFDPITMALLGSVPISFGDARAIGVAADGTIFIANWGGQIGRFNQAGTLIDNLTPGGNFADIDIDPTGKIALGTAFSGEIVLTDLSLDAATRFRATDSTSGGEVFVAWVPEPGATALSLLALAGKLGRRGPQRSRDR
jgi:hypothetical protein